MERKEIRIGFTEYESIAELEKDDALLLEEARSQTQNAYAPYSGFAVGAAARMSSGALIYGSNQENASFPAGLCAERVLLSNAASVFPGQPIRTLAISYNHHGHTNDEPISPCGICRQALQEYEHRVQEGIKLILAGQSGKIMVLDKASDLLPLPFKGDRLIG